MSDHVDGPRSIGEPAADVTDLFAFTSPENAARTVLAMCVFPSAGEDAIFSNVSITRSLFAASPLEALAMPLSFSPADDEIYAGQGRTNEAEALLVPALSSGDPEVRWRLGDVLIAQQRFEEAETQLEAARLGFEGLLGRHLLAFADHAAEFYAGSGNDSRRALELARTNVANRPTHRAVKQTHAIAVNADEADRI